MSIASGSCKVKSKGWERVLGRRQVMWSKRLKMGWLSAFVDWTIIVVGGTLMIIAVVLHIVQAPD